ncbi:MAG: methyl-accepting chemotaxis protein [Synergistaceae bacterium]|nr:methyl-accepting chemotaxis protein [Synergistaceae bacterium]
MWRNLKISKKLFLGFSLILFVFLVSTFMTWYYIKIVEDGSILLSDKIAPVMYQVTELNKDAYDVFLAMRTAQYTENQNDIANYKASLAKTLKEQDEMIAMNKKDPELRSPAHINNVVAPLSVKYVDHVNKIIAQIDKKQALLNVFSKTGFDTSTAMDNVMIKIHDNLRKSVLKLSDGADTNGVLSLVDAFDHGARLLEKVMIVRRDVWYSIAIAQAGGGVESMQEIVVKVKELQSGVEELKPFFVNSKEDEKILEDLISDFKVYENNLIDFMNTFKELTQLHKDRAPIMNSLSTEINAATSMAVDRMDKVSDDNVEYLNQVLIIMAISTAIAVLLAIVIVLFIARSISRPLNNIVNLARNAGDGDLTIKKADFRYDGRDEMGSMVTALADMIGSQNTTMTRVVEIAKELSNGAGDLSAISEETNASMEEIKASVSQVKVLTESNGSALEESNAGVEEMNAGADTVAQSATDSAAFISQTTEASNKAIQTVRNVIEGMHNVDKNAKESEGKTRQLVSSVENVSSFVSVITGIADQTNLLALNAAIEAARAGEVGRGFAVVAEEVRKLAEESAQAAKNVNEIIQELQNGAQESIKATTEAGRLLVSTLDHAELALDELNSALNQMNKANDSIQNIAAVAQEQAASSKEVATAIDNITKSSVNMVGTVENISRATDETAQATEGVAKQAEAMTQFAKTLTDMLSMFKLEAAQTGNTRMIAGR